MYISKRIEMVAHSPIRKFNGYAANAQQKGKKIYKLNIGQPDIETPKCFSEAIKDHISDTLTYSESEGDLLLRGSISHYFKMYGMKYSPDEIIITNGGSEALSMAFSCILDPGDNVVIPEPFYTNYHAFVAAACGTIVPITTAAEDCYNYADVRMIENSINDRTRAIVCTTPGNPTGRQLTLKDMKLIGEIAKKHDLWIISDEVYREFVFNGREITSFGMLPELAERVIITDSISKRFSACGARVGCLISKNRKIIGNAMKIAQSRLSCPTLEQIGAAALYNLDFSYYDKMRDEFEARRDAVYEELIQIPGIVCDKPGGSFYIMAKLPVDNIENFLIFLLTEFDDAGETVMFTPAEGFYVTPGLGHNEIRLAYVLNKNDMKRGAELIKLGLKMYQNHI